MADERAVLVIGEIRLFREGLMQLLNADGRLHVHACADSVAEGVRMVQSTACSIAIIDMASRGSIDSIRDLRTASPDLKIVAVGVADIETDIVACAEAGIDGYVPRGASLDDLIKSVESAINGEVYCSPRAVGQLFRRLAELAPGVIAPEPNLQELTRRERQVLELMSNGLSNKQIARTLGIELCTVKNHVHHVLEKLNVRRRAQITSRYPIPGTSVPARASASSRVPA